MDPPVKTPRHHYRSVSEEAVLILITFVAYISNSEGEVSLLLYSQVEEVCDTKAACIDSSS